MNDWKGNKNSTWVTLGASNHSLGERQKEDYYATEPAATEWLCKLETFTNPILEPSCGEGHISKQLIKHGYDVVSRDLVDRGYGEVADYLTNNEKWEGDIITNPPYSKALEFVKHSLDIISSGHKVAMFLKLTFLEGKKRAEFFKNCPPRTVYISSSRLKCAMNGDFNSIGSSATAYAWFVWEKGYKGYPEIRWFND